MSVVQVGAYTTATGYGSSLTVSYPLGIAIGDMVFCIVALRGNDAPSVPFNTVAAAVPYISGVGVNKVECLVMVKYADGSEHGTFAVTTVGATSQPMAIVVFALRGRFAPSGYSIAINLGDPTTASSANTLQEAHRPNVLLGGVNPTGAFLLAVAAASNSGPTADSCTVSGANWSSVANLDYHPGGGTKEVLLCLAHNFVDTLSGAALPTFTWSGSQDTIVAACIGVVELNTTASVPSVWAPYMKDQPIQIAPRPFDQLRDNIFANKAADVVCVPTTSAAAIAQGWSYTNSFTRSLPSPGTAAAPAVKYWSRVINNVKHWLKETITYTGSDVTKVALYYSEDNEATYTPMTDEDGNYVCTLAYDGAHNLQSFTWGKTP